MHRSVVEICLTVHVKELQVVAAGDAGHVLLLNTCRRLDGVTWECAAAVSVHKGVLPSCLNS